MILFAVQGVFNGAAPAETHCRDKPVFLQHRPFLRRLQIETLKAEFGSQPALLFKGHATPENAAAHRLFQAAEIRLHVERNRISQIGGVAQGAPWLCLPQR